MSFVSESPRSELGLRSERLPKLAAHSEEVVGGVVRRRLDAQLELAHVLFNLIAADIARYLGFKSNPLCKEECVRTNLQGSLSALNMMMMIVTGTTTTD